ncbi:MAG TPA: YraN family protein [Syntrophomonadaceae bacterium]|nr:YraN family protein [Syntrophomonadaceae bacterium]
MKKTLGAKGEDLAVQFLQKQGYHILERNYRTRYGEIDIICTHQKNIVFVEVKSRRSFKYGHPEEAITSTKIAHIRKASLHYLSGNSSYYEEIRFDVISIDFSRQPPALHHLIAAF